MEELVQVKTITQVHQLLGLPKPKHPLVSVVFMNEFPQEMSFEGVKFSADLYFVSLKDGVEGALKYGRNSYDFEDGTLMFTKPNQIVSGINKVYCTDSKGWMLLFHPDLIRKSGLGENIDQYSYFSYDVNEALHLSEEEQEIVTDIVRKIKWEYQQYIDKHSQKLIVSNIELLLDYSRRYYDRQFYIRTNLNQDYVSKFETLLNAYFQSDKPMVLGLPTVKYCGESLNMSPNYLSDLLKKETGRSAKAHIQDYIINQAKNQLLSTSASIGEIAFALGFEYPQHFSQLFKRKTALTPAEYRNLN